MIKNAIVRGRRLFSALISIFVVVFLVSGCGPQEVPKTALATPKSPPGTTTVSRVEPKTRELKLPGSCCTDPKCDQRKFRKAGGVCAGESSNASKPFIAGGQAGQVAR